MHPVLQICLCIVALGAATLLVGVGFYWFAQGWFVIKDDAQSGDDGGGYLENERKRYRN